MPFFPSETKRLTMGSSRIRRNCAPVSMAIPYHSMHRRTFLKVAATSPVGRFATSAELFSTAAPQTIGGLHFGVETFSFHDLPPSGDPQLLPTIIRNMQDAGIPECEIMSGHI